RFAILPEEAMGTREPQALARSGEGDRHFAAELTRADADEGDAVAMARVHVGLDLEDEAGEFLPIRRDDPGGRFARLRLVRIVQKGIEQQLQPEIVDRAAEEEGREFTGENAGAVERG